MKRSNANLTERKKVRLVSTYRKARGLILKIKTVLHKPTHLVLTVHEFCTYMGLPYESVQELIKD